MRVRLEKVRKARVRLESGVLMPGCLGFRVEEQLLGVYFKCWGCPGGSGQNGAL